nr:AAA family ATPase [Kosakonia cowanii]
MNVEVITENPSANSLVEKMKQYNDEVNTINTMVENYDNSLDELKSNVWKSLRNICNDLIDAQSKQIQELSLEREDIISCKDKVQNEIKALNTSSIDLKKQTSNIDETVEKINSTLSSLGISHFKIKKMKIQTFFKYVEIMGLSVIFIKPLVKARKH